MAEPASWLLLEELANRIRQITPANGYHTDLGSSPVVLDEGELESEQIGTVIEATLVNTTSTSPTYISYDMDILVEFGVPRGTDNAKKLVHRAMVDLSRALMLKPKELPAFVRTFTQTGATLLSGEDAGGASFLVAQVSARAGLTELKQPESQ